MRLTRRQIVGGALGATVSMATIGGCSGPRGGTSREAEQVSPPEGVRPGEQPDAAPSSPVAVGSANGLRGVEVARNLMLNERADPLDAGVEGVQIQELDPDDRGVGLGGLPNEEGVVQLDASCMHGPTRRGGAVAALEDVATAAAVARAVMQHTDHLLLVGDDARRFALDLGFEKMQLLTERSRQIWLGWRARRSPEDDWLEASEAPSASTEGTIHMCCVQTSGDLASVTTTSGLSWKIPGRVGDSPILGAGQYCDNRVGAAGSTGRGEANIKTCGAFFVVEQMRLGLSPRDACIAALQRAIEMTEDRLLSTDGKPLFGLNFYALAKDGRWGGATIYQPSEEVVRRSPTAGRMAVADSDGARLELLDYLYSSDEFPEELRS